MGLAEGPECHYWSQPVPTGLWPSTQRSLGYSQGDLVWEREVSPSLSQPVQEYLQDLRDKMEAMTQYATDHTQKAQQGYVSRYTLRARHKKFQVGTKSLSCSGERG